MRISTLETFNRALQQMNRNNAEMDKTRQQVASGNRLGSAADDPVAAARILSIEQEAGIRSQYQSNLDIAENSLKLEDVTLSGVVNVLQRLRELTVQSGNGTYSDLNRQAIADEIAVRLDELKSLMNQRNADGVYIFAGYQATEPPFIERAGGGFGYVGDEGQREVQIGLSSSIKVNDSGKKLFVDIEIQESTVLTSANGRNTAEPPATISVGQIVNQASWDEFYPDDLIIEFQPETAIVPAGPNYSIVTREGGITLASTRAFADGDAILVNGISATIDGVPRPGDTFFLESSNKQDVLTTVRRLEDALNSVGASDASREQLQTVVDQTLSNIDSSLESVLEVLSEVGGRLNTVTSTRSLHESMEVLEEQILAEIKYVDEAEAISTLTLQSYLLQAAQQSFITVNNLSLFNKLS